MSQNALAAGTPPPELMSIFVAEDGTEIDGLTFLQRIRPMSLRNQDHLLWVRCRWDLELFCVVFFPDRFSAPFNRLHRFLFGLRKTAWLARLRPTKLALEAPRAAAKSTILSFASVIHDAVYGLELFTGIASTDYNLSETLLSDLYDVFKDAEGYAQLHQVYGPFSVAGSKTDFAVRVPGMDKRGSKMKAYSMGGACRGHKHKGVRFTKWILDDAEHPKRVRNADLRDADEQFIDRDIEKSGGRFTGIQMAGTAQHPDCVVSRKRRDQKGGWDGYRYRSIISWPGELDLLWEDCRTIYSDLELGDTEAREIAAKEFYDRHREAMDAGAEVLWPEQESLFELMLMFWADEAAFYAEKQNEPSQSKQRTFRVHGFHWVKFDGTTITRISDGKTVDIRTCSVHVHMDPKKLSKKGTGRDNCAIATLARDRNGYRYTLDVRLVDGPPEDQIDAFIDLWDAWGPQAEYTYETNEGLDLDVDEYFRRRCKSSGGRYSRRNFHPRGFQSKQDKVSRIARIQPDTSSGHLQFNELLPPEVQAQFTHFPNATFDDAPDAIERADWFLGPGREEWGGV